MRWDFALFDYGPQWRANRRVFHQYFNQNEIVKYRPIIEHHTSIFLRRLVAQPLDFGDIIKQ
jgi:cytochrome P450